MIYIGVKIGFTPLAKNVDWISLEDSAKENIRTVERLGSRKLEKILL